MPHSPVDVSRSRPVLRRACKLAVLLWSSVWMSLAAAGDGARFLLVEENDGFFTSDDRHYTQGSLMTWLSPSLPAGGFWDRSFDAIAFALPMWRHDADTQRRIEWHIVGQSQFAPEDLDRLPPDPKDRPYAGWLYTGVGWLQENRGRSLHHLQVLAGVVGPAALARELGNGFHTVFGFDRAAGWDHQIGDRGAFQFAYDYRRRVELTGRDGGAGVDLVPELGLELGTILRYAEAGVLLRVGNAGGADYGPVRIGPSLSGTAFSDSRRLAEAPLSYTFFAGGQFRRVAHNVFIDAAEEVAPPGLARAPWVADLVTGASCWIGPRVRLELSVTWRTEEYRGQPSKDTFGAASFSWAL